MRLAHFDLNLLVSLDALLAEKNISRAAARLGVTQSAMSKALQRARLNFDDPLLIRVGREYSLTPFATELAESLHGALIELEDAMLRRPAFSPGTDKRTFRIACSDAAEYLLIRPLLKRIAEQAPGIQLAVQALAGSLTGQLVERREIDIALSSLKYYRGDLCNEVLYTDRRVCAVWQSSPVSDPLTWRQLLTMPHAGYNWPTHDPFEELPPEEVPERELVDSIPVRFADGNHLTRLLLLPETDLIMFTYEQVARHMARIAEIKIVMPPFEPQEVPFGMLWHPRNTDEPAHRWLREQLKEIAQPLAAARAAASAANA